MARARTLTTALKDEVPAKTRQRGEHYFTSGRVRIGNCDSEQVTATVRGTRTYSALLRLEPARLLVECSCPQFARSLDVCKHIWAVIREADAQALLIPDGPLYIDVDHSWYDEPAVLDDEPDDAAFDVAPRFGAPSATANDRVPVSEQMKAYRDAPRKATSQPPPRPKPLEPEPWQTFLMNVLPEPPVRLRTAALIKGELIYVFDADRSVKAAGLYVELMTRERKKSGDWGKPKPISLMRSEVTQLPNEDDRWLLESMAGALASYGGYDNSAFSPVPTSSVLNPTLQRALAPRLCATGRFVMREPAAGPGSAADPLLALAWDPEPTTFQVQVTGDATRGYTVTGILKRADRTRPLDDLRFLTRELILAPSEEDGTYRFGALQCGGADRWLSMLMRLGAIHIPASHADTFVEALALAQIPLTDCPAELLVESLNERPQPILRIAPSQTRRYYGQHERLELELSFRYGTLEVGALSTMPAVIDVGQRRSWRRDRADEDAAMARLVSLGARRVLDPYGRTPQLELAPKELPALVRVLAREGWHIEAEGRLHRAPGAITLDVRSGIDWFELHGGIDFGGVTASLPALLSAIKRGDSFVTLDDGSVGQLPDAWLARSGWIAELGSPDGSHVRFRRSQTALLDAWLAAQPEVSVDEAFAQARQQLATFTGIADVEVPATFHGSLRGYQRDALGWFAFLRQFGFGGVLADEMGLGKTVMVLAALDAHRQAAGDRRPSLIVVPRSLVFNWQNEAQRFAPALRVLDCSSASRRDLFASIGDYDMVLATYGTMRRDIELLKDIAFEYVILDEAQAIKNVRTNSAAAVRLLQGRHRLALSGTPVENHLGELWSLFEFLNPGMLGKAQVFAGASSRAGDEERLSVLARGLRPFILRRTKEQVAKELPSRTEQTLYCDLEPAQRSVYDGLRAHYRATLLKRVDRDGLGRSKMYVLEALLRLRQAACHPRLVDPKGGEDISAKFDALVPRLQELAEDGRKVLVFSQFTSLLALLRARLNDAGLTHAYLDGRTKDRAARVREFEETACPIFLISLKAGGLGLNLTAAEYVFLLDPWWNPAVEAQAIDRAHRIGQTKAVFAYRLIARDTVEEKVLELQATKRRLAEAIVRADEGLIRDLRREDLELLLS
jgi:superfamily II DNA or RNA helicase